MPRSFRTADNVSVCRTPEIAGLSQIQKLDVSALSLIKSDLVWSEHMDLTLLTAAIWD